MNASSSDAKYKDISFAVLFIMQFLVVLGLALSFGVMAVSNTSSPDQVEVDKDGR